MKVVVLSSDSLLLMFCITCWNVTWGNVFIKRWDLYTLLWKNISSFPDLYFDLCHTLYRTPLNCAVLYCVSLSGSSNKVTKSLQYTGELSSAHQTTVTNRLLYTLTTWIKTVMPKVGQNSSTAILSQLLQTLHCSCHGWNNQLMCLKGNYFIHIEPGRFWHIFLNK